MIHEYPPRVRVIRIVNNSSDAPPRFAEYTYYAFLFYGIMAPIWGLEIPLLNISVLAVLAVYCVLCLGPRTRTFYAPLVLPLGCGISYIAVQLAFHDEPLMGASVRNFVPWMLALIIVQWLSLRNEFLHRFACATFVLGLVTLPYLQFRGSGGSDLVRMRLDQTIALSNPNDLGAWFGFCCVYFAIAGLETKRNAVRAVLWLAAGGCLYVVGLTVSRAPLFATAIAIVVALRRLLKRGFVPVLVLLILSWIIGTSGLFERIIALYATRGLEDTGRLAVWPLVIERFLSSPLIGVGDSHIATRIPSGPWIMPHNSFLQLALGSGVVPLVFFLGWWIRAFREVFGTNVTQRPDAPFRLPLLIYAFLISLQLTFLIPWMIVTLSMATGPPRRLRWVKRQDMAQYGGALE